MKLANGSEVTNKMDFVGLFQLQLTDQIHSVGKRYRVMDVLENDGKESNPARHQGNRLSLISNQLKFTKQVKRRS